MWCGVCCSDTVVKTCYLGKSMADLLQVAVDGHHWRFGHCSHDTDGRGH